MKLAVSLWRLFQTDRLFRWATYASIVVLWFAIAWADVRLLGGLLFVALGYWWLRRQREKRGWLSEPEVDVDLL
jgi:formate/nitrite transporter FocA (FNT family)